jgi:hypothetical protein
MKRVLAYCFTMKIIKRKRYTIILFIIFFIYIYRLINFSRVKPKLVLKNNVIYRNNPTESILDFSNLTTQYKIFMESIHDYYNISFKKGYESRYSCLGQQNVFEQKERRSCRFRNICYNISSKHYLYYQPKSLPVFYDRDNGPIYNFGDNFIQVNAIPKWNKITYFTPKIVIGSPNPDDAIFINTQTVLWAHWAYEFNMGHLIYEELASTFVALRRFGITHKNNQLLNM